MAGTIVALLVSALGASLVLGPVAGARRVGRWLHTRWGWQWPSATDTVRWSLGTLSGVCAVLADRADAASTAHALAMSLALLGTGGAALVHIGTPRVARRTTTPRAAAGISASRD